MTAASHDNATRGPGDAAAADTGTRAALVARVNALYHDLQAPQFDRAHRARHRVERLFWVRDVAPRLAARGARFGIDLCSGTGFVARELLARLDADVRMLCTDVSASALQRAKASAGPHAAQIAIHAGDIRQLPADDASADWVSMNAALHHIDDVAAVLAEADRVLKPGGLFALGHEPNAAFFRSRTLPALERLIWLTGWYTSPARNWQRLRRRRSALSAEGPSGDFTDEINRQLAAEGLTTRPLSSAEIHDLVDVRTHEGTGRDVGFVPRDLLREYLRGYEVEQLVFTDYGGEMLRPLRPCRAAYDGLMRLCCPGRGQLFSWIVRKPGGSA